MQTGEENKYMQAYTYFSHAESFINAHTHTSPET